MLTEHSTLRYKGTMKNEKYILEIQKGLLVLAVLQVIKHKKVYAGEIIRVLKTTAFATQEGTLYPLLSRLKREGLIVHEWVESPSGPPRKYFRLSNDGESLAKSMSEHLRETTLLMKKLGGEQ